MIKRLQHIQKKNDRRIPIGFWNFELKIQIDDPALREIFKTAEDIMHYARFFIHNLRANIYKVEKSPKPQSNEINKNIFTNSFSSNNHLVLEEILQAVYDKHFAHEPVTRFKISCITEEFKQIDGGTIEEEWKHGKRNVLPMSNIKNFKIGCFK